MINIYVVGIGMKGRGPGGFANMIQFEDQPQPANGELYQDSGCAQDTTPQRLTMVAVRKALRTLLTIDEAQNHEIVIYSDDKILVPGMNERWFDKWQQTNWTKRNGRPVKHADLWKDLLVLMHDKNITFDFFNSNHDIVKNDLSKIAIEQQKLASDGKCTD